MNNKPVYLTAEGLTKLKAELNHLITSERPRVAARIHDAKLDGDITENAEYEDAKQEGIRRRRDLHHRRFGRGCPT